MTSVPELLKDLADLLEKELITREQFEEQRDQILAETRTRASASASDPTMLTEVGAYRLLGLIGEGGMGAVYRGRHLSETMAERQGGDVAVKVMHPQYTRNPDYRDRFEREAALGMKLDHPGIVKVHDLVVDGGNLALVMDLIEGQPLSESIGEAAGPIPWNRAWPLFQRLLEAVGYAHDQGVVHRDIKPENILVTPDGEPHVIDFGIAKDVDGSGTRTGTGMGTVEYMAPEQYTDAKAVDRRADVYSLGMILYEMLAGRLPWDANAPQFRILEQKANKELMSPSAFVAGIPPEIVAALSPVLAAAPGARPAMTSAFANALVDASARVAERRRVEAEQQRQAREAVERRTRAATEPRVPLTAPHVQQTSADSGEVDDGKQQRGRHRLLLASAVLTGLLLAVGVILVMGVRNANPPATSTPALGGEVIDQHGYEMVSIEPGEFWMGSPSDEKDRDDDETRHKVRLTRAFHIGATEVTQELYEAVMGPHHATFEGARHPVQDVSWYDAVAFCNELSKQEGKRAAYRVQGESVTWDHDADGYRLPTEAEWEYAARGGEEHVYSGSDDLGTVGWYDSNSDNVTHEVGGKRANGYGLYDMTGNLHEWVWDWYGDYPSGTVTDPTGPSTGSDRVTRGGGWGNSPRYARVAIRVRFVPGLCYGPLGFRLARSLP